MSIVWTEIFAGRERELDALQSGLSAIARGRGGVFLVSGEPGIGKTRLIEELGAIAEGQGAIVAWGTAWDGGGAPAYWPWAQVLRQLASVEGEQRLHRDLGPILGGTAETLPDSAGELEIVEFRLFPALRSVLETYAARAPLVIVLDDLHAADTGSLQALRFLSQNIRTLPILLIAVHRDGELTREAATTLGHIARTATMLRVGPLSREAVEELLRVMPISGRVVDEVAELTAGNPLFIGEVVHRIRNDGVATSPSAGVRAAIRERIGRFATDTRDALAGASILGRESATDVLAEVCQISSDELEERLRPARLAGILDQGSARAVRFAHPLFHECVYDSLPSTQLKALHVRAGEVLSRAVTASNVTSIESVAHHLLRALPEGDALQAADWAERAGAIAFRSLAFDRAAAFWEGALGALARSRPDPGREIDVELLLARALARTGAGERARQMCQAAAARAHAMGDKSRFARCALAYGEEVRVAVVDPTLVDLLAEALRQLDERDGTLRARVMARLAAAQQPAADARLPIQNAQRALQVARTVDDTDTLVYVLHWAAAAFSAFAHPADRLAIGRELSSRALWRGDLLLAQEGSARRAVAAAELCSFEEVDEAIRAHDRLGVALGHPRWRWKGLLMRSMRALIEGRWDDADAAQAEAGRIIADLDDMQALASLTTHRLGAIRARGIGTIADVQACINQAPAVATAYGTRLLVVRAATLLRLGHLEAARQVLLGARLPFSDWQPSPYTLAICAEVAVGLGDRELAGVLLPALQDLDWPCLVWGGYNFIWEGPLNQWIGRLLVLLDRADEAVPLLQDALAMAEGAGAHPVAERIRGDLDALRATNPRASQPKAAIAKSKAVAGRDRAPSFALIREGDVWSVVSGDRTAHIRHSRGVELLSELARSPGREFHVLDFVVTDPAADCAHVDRGDAGVALDERAKSAYRNRLRSIETELREADEWADVGRRERLTAEREFLMEEISRATALGGRDRRMGAAAERARINVQKRLREAIRRIGDVFPELGDHLRKCIKTGTYVSYRPMAVNADADAAAKIDLARRGAPPSS
jgi:hypothetical protein